MSEPPGGELVRRTRLGDNEAYGELVRRHQTAVYNVCLRLLGDPDDAADFAQATFLHAYEKLHTFDTSRPFGPWIRRLAANTCVNDLRRRRPESVAESEVRRAPSPAAWANPEASLYRTLAGDEVRAAILALPDHYRAVLELRHFQEFTYAEIGEALSLPMSDVKSHLYRARRALAATLAGGRS